MEKKKILVPFDFTEYSGNALRYARHFARVKNMKIKILHVVEEARFRLGAPLTSMPFIGDPNEPDFNEIADSTEEHIKRMVSLEEANGIEIEYEVKRATGSVVKAILAEDCDVIIMGRHSHPDKIMFAGSTAEKVIRVSPIPVITVGNLPAQSPVQIKNIIFASDFNDEEIKPILTRVNDLAEIFHAKLSYVYVELNRHTYDVPESQAKLEGIVKRFGLDRNVDLYFADTAEEGIERAIDETEADLLVMCTHGRTGLTHFFVNSVAEDMVAFADVPVLTYNINKKKAARAARPLSREGLIRFRGERTETNQKSTDRDLP